ncbi:hypothetical protein [Actinoplanes sp. NPDC051851]|uniref:hypothetical protein n=1 Tax=Actinoplanes sp. NPDC051851 TaxID=3154753 RepID=UPI003412FD91
MALLLDLANIIGGLLLAVPLLLRLPTIGYDLGRFAARIAGWTWIIGVVALVAGGYWLLVHIFSGPGILHFEVVGIAVGLLLTWDRLTGRRVLPENPPNTPVEVSGPALIIAIVGLIAIVVGVQGLFTPN